MPYNALIIAREKMNIYAYMSIIEALLKVGSVLLLIFFTENKLIIYSVLTFLVALLIRIFYQVYCRKKFIESKYKFVYDKAYYSELIGYSGWNLFGNIAVVARGQGINIVLNLFFGTVVNAAYGITNQVINAVSLFVTNLQLAFNPQIIINYSNGDISRTQKLIFQGSKISFLLMLILVLPILQNTNYILTIWLKIVPKYTTTFVQLGLIGVLIDSLSGTLMTGAQATGKIKLYQVVVGTMIFLNLPLSYLALKLGFEAYYVFVISIFISLISLNFRVYFLYKILKINVIYYYKAVLFPVFLLSGFGFGLLWLSKTYLYFPMNFYSFLLESIGIILIMLIAIFMIGITNNEKQLLMNLIKKKVLK